MGRIHESLVGQACAMPVHLDAMTKRAKHFPHASAWRDAGRIAMVSLLGTIAAYAEPHLSGGETRAKWAIAIMITGAVAAGAAPALIRKFAKLPTPTWAVVVISTVLVLAWTLFVGPVIVVIGAILIAGRTM